MSGNVDDMSKSRKEEKGKKSGGAGQKAANTAKKAKKASKFLAKFKNFSFVVKFLFVFWWIVLAIVIIFLLIGAIQFFTTMPGMMIDKITEVTSGLWADIKGFFEGSRAYIKEEDQVELANYLQNMGYDLYGYGFGSPTEIGEGGEVAKINNKYLFSYLLADYNTYEKDVGGLQRSFMQGWKNFWGLENEPYTGMLRFEDTGMFDGVEITTSREQKTLTIKVWDPRWTSWDNTDSYTFDIDGWSGRYGRPLEFLLTLHLATMAPDLALHVASDPEFDTKVHIGFDSVTGFVSAKYVINAETVKKLQEMDGNGEEKNKVIWNIEGLESILDKIADDGTITLDTEDFKKMHEIYNGTYGEFDNFEAAIAFMEDFIPYLDKLIAGEETFPGVLYNTPSPNNVTTKTGVGAEQPIVVTDLGGIMDSTMRDARETDSKVTYKADTEDFYQELIGSTEGMDGDMTEKEYATRMKNALQKALDTAKEDLPVMKEHSDETAKEREKIAGSLKEIGLTDEALEQAIDLNSRNGNKGTEIKSKQPYITYVDKAWFKNIYFIINDSIRNGVGSSDPELANLEDFDAYLVEDDVTTELAPYTFNPSDDSNQSDMIANDKGEFKISEKRENTTSRKQTQQPKRGATNPRIKELLVGTNEDSKGTNPKPKYYIYDGTKKTAETIDKLKAKEIEWKNANPFITQAELDEKIEAEDTTDVYKEINFTKNALSAFTILENMKTEDAEYILRDLKSLLVELKYFKASDLQDKYVGLLDWIIPAYQPEEWPEREFEKQNYEYGTLIKYRENIVKGGKQSSANLDILKISDQEAWKKLTNNKISSRPQDKGTNSDLQNEVDKKIKEITVKIRTWAGTSGLDRTEKEVSLQINEELEEVWTAFFEDLYKNAPDFCITQWGGYRVDGTGVGQVGQKSAHNYGAAVDLNWDVNPYGPAPISKAEWEALPETRIKYETIYVNSPMVEIAHKYTLSWGGDWSSVKDNMHFSFFGDENRDTLIQKWGSGQTIQNASIGEKIESLDGFLFIGDSYTKRN